MNINSTSREHIKMTLDHVIVRREGSIPVYMVKPSASARCFALSKNPLFCDHSDIPLSSLILAVFFTTGIQLHVSRLAAVRCTEALELFSCRAFNAGANVSSTAALRSRQTLLIPANIS